MQNKTLRRSATNQVIAGVCGGVGEYFEVDPTIVRLLFIFMAFAAGSGIPVYIISWLIIPGPTSAGQPAGETTVKEGLHEMESKFNEVKSKVENEFAETEKPFQSTGQSTQSTETNWLGIALILVGGGFFLANFGFFRFIDFGKLWPVIFIVLGLYTLTKKK